MAIHTHLVTYIYIYLVTYYVQLNLVMLVFVRPNSSYVRPKLKVIGQMSCQVKYLFAALESVDKFDYYYVVYAQFTCSFRDMPSYCSSLHKHRIKQK
jgi:hypothetical protein